MKVLKIVLISLVSLGLALYFAFLFILPFAIDLNKYSDLISKTVEDSCGFKLKVDNMKLVTGWNLTLGAYVAQADVMYPSSEKFVQVDDLNVKISLPHLLIRRIKLDTISLGYVVLRVKVRPDGKFLIEEYLPKASSQPAAAEGLPFGFVISDNMPNINLKKYDISFVDMATNKFYTIKGDNFSVSDFILGKKFKLQTVGEVVLDNRKQLGYDLALGSKLIFDTVVAPQDETSAEFVFNIIDMFKNLYKLNLVADVKCDLKLHGSLEDIKADGYVDVEKLSMIAGGKKLPDSMVKLKFKNSKAEIDSNLYTSVNENTLVKGNFEYGKKSSVDMSVKSEKTNLTNLVQIANALLQLFGITDLDNVNADGVLSADFNIKSNFKKINSDGFLKVDNANVYYNLFNIAVKNINADVDFSNNKIMINKSNATLNGAPISLTGFVDTDSNADLSVVADKLPVKGLLATLGQIQLLKENDITSGFITIKGTLKGKLDKAMPQVNVLVSNVALKNKPSKAYVNLNNANIKVDTNGVKTNGNVAVNSLKVSGVELPLISVPTFNMKFNEKDIKIVDSYLYLNNSKIDVYGDITDYSNSKTRVNIVARGLLIANDLKNMLPKELRADSKAAGKLPLIVKIVGNSKVQDITSQVLANQTNYLSLMDVNVLSGKTSLINLDAKLQGDVLRIEDISLNSLSVNRGLTDNFKNNIAGATKIAGVKGAVTNLYGKVQTLQNINVNIPNQLNISIPGFKGSSASFKGDLNVAGTSLKPIITGQLSLPAISIPTLKTNLKNVSANFGKNSINVTCPQLNIDNSRMSFTAIVDPDFSRGILVKGVDFNADNIDLDTLGAALSNMPQNSNAPGTDLGITVLNGKGKVGKFKLGGLAASNINADFDLKHNVLYLKNIKGDAYGGKIAGNISYNILYGNIGINLQGRGLSGGPAITGLTGLKNPLEGKLDFDANDLTLVGATQEQMMRSLKGSATFIISDGQMGSLGKLEHLLYAQNILTNNVLQRTLGSVAKAVSIKKTGDFKYIKGKMTFSNGWANISKIQTSGPSMSMFVKGQFNLLNNSANLIVYGRLSDDVVQILGPIGEFSVNKLISSIPKIGNITASLLNQLTTDPKNEDISELPALTPTSTAPTKEFKISINGGVESQSSIKYFKWLSTPKLDETTQVPALNIPTSKEELKQTVKEGATNALKQWAESKSTTTTTPTTTTEPKTGVGKTLKKINQVADFVNSLPELGQ